MKVFLMILLLLNAVCIFWQSIVISTLRDELENEENKNKKEGNINFLKRNQLSQDRIDEDTMIIRTLKFYFNNYNKEG